MNRMDKQTYDEIANLKKDNSDLAEELVYAYREAEYQKDKAKKIEKTFSWRITKPLRWYRLFMKKRKKRLYDISNYKVNLYKFRIPKDELVKTLSRYDIISFNVFDILVFANLIHNKHAEYLCDVDCISNKDVFEALTKNSSPNPYLKEVYDELVKLNKKIIITTYSDYSKEQLISILNKCGFNKIDGVYKLGFKHRLYLYTLSEEFISDFQGKKLIHVGGNYEMDIEPFRDNGFSTYTYRTCKDIAKRYKELYEKDTLFNSLVSSMKYNYLYNGNTTYTQSYRYGYNNVGLLTCGMIEYIDKMAKINNIDKIWFIKDTSHMLYEIYNEFGSFKNTTLVDTTPNAVFEVSFEQNMLNFIKYYFESRIEFENYTIRDCMLNADLEFLMYKLKDYGVDDSEMINPETLLKVKDLIADNKDEIINKFSETKKYGEEYFYDLLDNKKKIMIVDLSVDGYTIAGLYNMLSNKKVKVIGVNAVVNADATYQNFISDGIIYPYLIEPSGMFYKLERESAKVVFSLIYASKDNPILKYGKRNTYTKDKRDTVYLTESKEGIIDFIKQYKNLNLNKTINCFDAVYGLISLLRFEKYNAYIFRNFVIYENRQYTYQKYVEMASFKQLIKIDIEDVEEQQ